MESASVLVLLSRRCSVQFTKVLGVVLLLVSLSSASSAQISFPTIQTSGNHRFIEHTGKEKTLQGQLLAARTAAQRLLKQVNRTPMSSVGDNDWAFDVGANGPASGWPPAYTPASIPHSSHNYVPF